MATWQPVDLDLSPPWKGQWFILMGTEPTERQQQHHPGARECLTPRPGVSHTARGREGGAGTSTTVAAAGRGTCHAIQRRPPQNAGMAFQWACQPRRHSPRTGAGIRVLLGLSWWLLSNSESSQEGYRLLMDTNTGDRTCPPATLCFPIHSSGLGGLGGPRHHRGDCELHLLGRCGLLPKDQQGKGDRVLVEVTGQWEEGREAQVWNAGDPRGRLVPSPTAAVNRRVQKGMGRFPRRATNTPSDLWGKVNVDSGEGAGDQFSTPMSRAAQGAVLHLADFLL